MKILFYDIKEIELDYLLEKIKNKIEPYFFNTPLNENTFIHEKYLNCEALSTFVSSNLNEKVLSKFKNLKYIFLRCVGYSNVDLKYCKKNNIKIYNTPNYGNSTVAEYVFSLLLNVSKKINDSRKAISTGEINSQNLIGIELCEKTMGIIGLGAIGRKVMNIAHGFNMEVLAYDTNPVGAYDFVSLEELLKKSDFISINCPLTPKTKNLINRETLSMMKKSAILINCARGETVNTKDLYEALVNKKIQGAGLDVIECEELLCENYKNCVINENFRKNCLKKFFFIQKLLQLPNVIITPHNAYNPKEAQHRILRTTLLNIQTTFDTNSRTKNLVLI